MKLARLIAIAAAAAALTLPTTASAGTFGANLGVRTANSEATCAYPPYYPVFPGISPMGSSCTFFSTATPTGEAAETHVVPLPDPAIHGNQKGTITQVRIETGPGAPGPAKLTILRANRAFNGGEAACCIGQAESAQFTLNPNTTVYLNTDLPVESKYDAGSRIYSYDILALSVLDSTTPIPAELSGNYSSGYCSGGYFPYIQTGQERFTGEYGVCGYLVLMQADLSITTPAAVKIDDGPVTDNDFEVVGKPRTTKDGNIALTLDLPGAGKVTARATANVPAGLLARASAKKKRLLVAKRAVAVAKAGKLKLVLKPTKVARKAIERQGKLVARVRIAYTPSGGATKTVFRRATFR